MITVKRKAVNNHNSKAFATVTNAVYNINLPAIEKVKNYIILKSNDEKLAVKAKQVLKDEVKWLDRWLTELRQTVQALNANNAIKTQVTLLEQSNGFSYIDTDDCSIDLFNRNLYKSNKLKSDELMKVNEAIAKGIANNFRFYTRPDTRIIVLDYRCLMDYVALYYGYRELEISIEQIESVLENCSAAVINGTAELHSIVKFCLANYTSAENLGDTIVVKNAKPRRDGDLYDLITQFRISTNCFQVIRSSNQVETWQHHRLNLTPNMTYEPVLKTAQTEIIIDIINGMTNAITNNKNMTNVKIMSEANGLIALSVPNAVTNEDIHTEFDVILRVFNRLFAVKPKLYTYSPDLDKFQEEATVK